MQSASGKQSLIDRSVLQILTYVCMCLSTWGEKMKGVHVYIVPQICACSWE